MKTILPRGAELYRPLFCLAVCLWSPVAQQAQVERPTEKITATINLSCSATEVGREIMTTKSILIAVDYFSEDQRERIRRAPIGHPESGKLLARASARESDFLRGRNRLLPRANCPKRAKGRTDD